MIINWNTKIKNYRVSNALIDLTDFYATFEDILNVKNYESYGKSLIPLLLDDSYLERDVLVTYYNPMWSTRGLDRGIFAQSKDYKLYKKGKFFKYSEDIYEKKPISTINLTKKENEVYNLLKKSLDTIPDLPKENYNQWR